MADPADPADFPITGAGQILLPGGARDVIRAGDESGRHPILAFHGGGGGPAGFAFRTGLAEALGALGQRALFPQAQGHWADGRTPNETTWADDRLLVDRLLAQETRVSDPLQDGPGPFALLGSSNGGMFALRLACEMEPKPAAVVAVLAAMALPWAGEASPGAPVPAMIVQATDDRVIPWGGGEVPSLGGLTQGGEVLGAEATIRFWKRRNRVKGEPQRRRGRLRSPEGDLKVEISAWTAPPGGADLWRVVIGGLGHGWPERAEGAGLTGTLEELVARFLVWHLDRDRLLREGKGNIRENG
jgi:polyhydroxybutyrate depolymerase